jgi:hypothetical protein
MYIPSEIIQMATIDFWRLLAQRGRRLLPSGVEELQFVIVTVCNVKKEINAPQWVGKLFTRGML